MYGVQIRRLRRAGAIMSGTEVVDPTVPTFAATGQEKCLKPGCQYMQDRYRKSSTSSLQCLRKRQNSEQCLKMLYTNNPKDTCAIAVEHHLPAPLCALAPW